LTFSITTFEQVTFSIIKTPRQWVREGKKRVLSKQAQGINLGFLNLCL